MSLAQRLRERIAEAGPLTIAEYMTLCLHDPADGYYAARPRLGEAGDFITAPLVSQMFGELIGLWAVEVWDRLGRPAPFRLVEVGPGDGTLIGDALRAARLVPAFREAADLWLVEPSAPLRLVQGERLRDQAARWASRLEEIPGGAPLILVANEVLDCLPARQFVRTETGWVERRVGLDADGRLVFGHAPAASGFEPPVQASPGQVVEVSAAQTAFAAGLAARIAEDGGAALLIDYGRDRPEPGDTLQAVAGHRKVDPLATPGEADLTVHADFPSVAAAALSEGAAVTPVRSQAAFLTALGIERRAAALARARPDRAETLARQLDRLIGPGQMGALFKAMAIHTPGLAIPGFEAQEES